ncbi:hypothetical protein [Psychrobacter sp. Sarcosine-3u-12]|uniref:hypothetical protein n=1 Tax=Psychrobacter sp. Sarcosine-3u-12 TaxID=2058325 RepID=UPI000C34051B|nr:hypothetical protein [Psychrobacter sp. Sarcosine-3u-12]PKG34196.1 hypothetical protein CXF65_14575 [Psychrobacter sp. Sarcosine-3u-12]
MDIVLIDATEHPKKSIQEESLGAIKACEIIGLIVLITKPKQDKTSIIIADVCDWVIDKLKDGRSPEQIVGFHSSSSSSSLYRYR